VYRDITAVKEDQLKQQMRDNRESHTFLLNRAAFFEQLRDISARPARETERSALILLNLDRFREINDTYGVAMGDEILSETARRLRRCLRDSDVISRLNGRIRRAFARTECGRRHRKSGRQNPQPPA
jgi:GGDEF domain-containing protein